MITLHFSPQFDSGAYSGEPGKGVSQFGESYVGPLGLLAFLEVRLGKTVREKPQHESLADYTKAAQEAARMDSEIFFADSLDLSPLATAGELLRWRDELVLSGWKADSPILKQLTPGAESILDGLAKVETLLHGFQTTSDRWQSLLSDLENETSLDGFSVAVHAPEDHMHPVHKAVLGHLRRCGIDVQSAAGKQAPQVEKPIKHFHDSSDACLWAAAQDGEALLVCSDDLTMSSAMAAFGRPYGNASASSTPRPVTHLFTGAMLLLKDAEDIHAFRDYLSPSSHPLNEYKKENRTLREALLNHVVRQRGFKDVVGIINDFADGDPKRIAEIRELVPEPGRRLTYARIKAMCDRISAWMKGSIKVVEKNGTDSAYLDQWKEVVSVCEEMKFQCKELDIDNHPEAFMNILRTVTAPGASIARHAVVGSVPIVSSIEKIAVDVQDVIWVDGSYTGTTAPMSFLCPKDVDVLKEPLPYIWAQDEALQLADDLFQAGLSHIGGKLTILYCDAFAGEKRETHPFILRQAESLDKLKNLPFEPVLPAKAEPCPNLPIVEIKEECDVNNVSLSIPDHESPTTLEDMFDQPLDWVLKSILHLYEESDSNDSLIKGLVAHDVIHRIYEKAAEAGSEVDANAFEQVFKTEFDSFFAAAVHDTGAELNLKENKLDCKQFKSDLQKVSIPKLVEILRYSHLTIVGSEVESKMVDISPLPPAQPISHPLVLSGTIDMLLKDEAGHYVILDFKWAGQDGLKKRTGQIQKGTDYQLALYRKLAEVGTSSIPAGTVDAQAFFMLKTAELLTAYPVFYDCHGLIQVQAPGPKTKQKTYSETMEEIYRKYSETVDAFIAGTIPSGKLKDPYLHYRVFKGILD